MMVVGYNGILFQDVGSVSNCGIFHKTFVTYKSLGHYHKAPALGYRHETLATQKEGETKRLINDNHQTIWSLYLFRTLDWQIAQRQFAIRSDQFMNMAAVLQSP